MYVNEGTAIIRSQNVYNGLFVPDGLAHLTDEHASQLKGVTVKERDVLINITGDSVARCCLAPKWVLPARVNQHVCIIRPDPTKLLPEFLHYYIVSPMMQTYLLSRAGSGGTRNALTKGMLESLEVPCPSIPIQRKIVEALKNYDDLIENNRRRIELLERAARILYKEWFVDLRFPGHERVPVRDGVPMGWHTCQLRDMADITMGQSPKSVHYNEDGIGLPFHQGVRNFGFRFPTHVVYSTNVPRIAEAGDILFSVRAPVGRINVALDRLVIGRGIASIRSKFGHQNYLLYALKNKFYTEDLMGSGSIYPAITGKELREVRILRPHRDVTKAFIARVEPIDRQIAVLDRQCSHLAQARDLLLPRLMNGEIAV